MKDAPMVKLLPEPSEYIDGAPQWNAYPFVRLVGDDIVVGAKGEGLYEISDNEARALARALTAAIAWKHRHDT